MPRETALVDCAWAQNHLDTPGVVFVETGNSDELYTRGHIPGAIWIGWDEFQDDLKLGVLDEHRFSRLLSSKGIGNDDTVVLYSAPGNLLAGLVYWYFTLYGHRSVRLLDGGRRRWEMDGRPQASSIPDATPSSYRAQPADTTIRATRDDVLAAIGVENIVDVRTVEEYCGARLAPAFAGQAFAPGNNPHEVAQRPGHVPGAVNLPWDMVLNGDETFRSDTELEELFALLNPTAASICYCWVGARSAHTWFTLQEVLGRPGVRNYDGSWAEYGSLVGVPIERGAGQVTA